MAVVSSSSRTVTETIASTTATAAPNDFIPPALLDYMQRPLSVKIDYKELPGDEMQFTYTLQWRGARMQAAKLQELGALQQQARSGTGRQEWSESKTTTTTASSSVSSGLGETPTSSRPRMEGMEATQMSHSPAPLSVSSSSGQAVDSPFSNLRRELLRSFDCPRYAQASPAPLSSRSAATTPVWSLPKGSPTSSARSYLGTPLEKERSRGRKREEPKKKTPAGEATVAVYLRLAKSPDVVVNLMTRVAPDSILHDAIDDLLRRNKEKRLLIKSYRVPEKMSLGERALTSKEYFCSSVKDLRDSEDGAVHVDIDLTAGK